MNTGDKFGQTYPLKCKHCGHIAGEVVLYEGAQYIYSLFGESPTGNKAQTYHRPLVKGMVFTCSACGKEFTFHLPKKHAGR